MKRAYLFATVGLAAVLGAAGVASGQNVGGRPFSITLTGAEEAPGPGDPDGSGEAHLILNQGQGVICYEITVSDIDPSVAAHIHEAPVGEPGPVVVPLEPPDEEGFVSACVDVDPELIADIRKNPDEYYLNVHTGPFPAGAVRGQLSK